MQNFISPTLVTVLLSADETGMISLPQLPRKPHESNSEIDDITRQFLVLEKLGFVSRPEGTASQQPFRLTEKGERLKTVLKKSEDISVPVAA